MTLLGPTRDLRSQDNQLTGRWGRTGTCRERPSPRVQARVQDAAKRGSAATAAVRWGLRGWESGGPRAADGVLPSCRLFLRDPHPGRVLGGFSCTNWRTCQGVFYNENTSLKD